MPMTEKAAQLYSMHKRKAERLWSYAGELTDRGIRFVHGYNLAVRHEEAAHAIYNCPDSWERSETDRKLAEIKAYLGSPLYDEWLEAGAAENFERYVADKYAKLFPKHTFETYESIQTPKYIVSTHDPRSLRERLHDEAGADLQRMTTDQRNGG